jgi:hypothetical protein
MPALSSLRRHLAFISRQYKGPRGRPMPPLQMPTYEQACAVYPGITEEFYTTCMEASSSLKLQTSKMYHGKCGRGVFATRDILKGEILCLVYGEPISRKQCDVLWGKRLQKGEKDHRYLMNVETPARGKFSFNLRGWAAGFFNQQRLQTRISGKWKLVGPGVGIVCATRDIPKGKEICVKYNDM